MVQLKSPGIFLGACFLNSHSHRGFSPVKSPHIEVWNRFNGFLFAAILLACQKKPLKRFL